MNPARAGHEQLHTRTPRYASRPSCQAGSSMRRARSPSTELAGAAPAAGTPRWCTGSHAARRRPARSKISRANSYQEHEPAPATWWTPCRARRASAHERLARWPVKVGQPTWSSTTSHSSRSCAEAQHRVDEVAPAARTATTSARPVARVGGRRSRARPRASSARSRQRADRVGLDVRLAPWSRRRRSRSTRRPRAPAAAATLRAPSRVHRAAPLRLAPRRRPRSCRRRS